jgi:hypothetical protein
VPDTAAGKQVKCPKCDTAVPVPASDPGFEVVDEAPTARPVAARPIAAAPARPRPRPTDDRADRPRRRLRDEDDEEDEDDDRPRRRPTRKRANKKASGVPVVPLIAAGGVGAFILIGGLVAYLVFGRDSGKSTTGPQAVAGRPTGGSNNAVPPSPPTSVPANWKTFSTPGSGLTVSVPVTLQAFNVPGRMRRPGISVAMWQALHTNDKIYQVMVITITKGRAPTGPTSDRDLEVLCDSFASSNDFGRERSRTRVNVGGHNGRQLVFDSAVIRITAVGRKAYFLSVATKGGAVNASDPDVTAFLESAKISG